MTDLYSKYWMQEIPDGDIPLISLAKYRRAVANFVRISTMSADVYNKNIKVKFNHQDESFTDKKNIVVISADISNNEFDAVVGLALDDGVHIIYTEDIVISAWAFNSNLRREIDRIGFTNRAYNDFNALRNWIEDRRIDQLSWKKSPGYKPYYDALYLKYFFKKSVTEALKSDYARTPDIDSYFFRIINSINPASESTALPNLDMILSYLTMEKCASLNSHYEACVLAEEVLELIYKELPDAEENEDAGGKGESNESDETSDSGEEGNDENSSGGLDLDKDGDEDMINVTPQSSPLDKKPEHGEGESGDKKSDGSDNESGNDSGNESDKGDESSESGDKGSSDKENKKSLSKSKIRSLEKDMDRIKDLVNGTVEKGKLSREENEILKTIEESNTTFQSVQTSSNEKNPTQVMVVNKLNKNILSKLSISYINRDGIMIVDTQSQDAVIKGIQLGKQLARKLQVRNDDKLIRTKRKVAGKIDKRLLHSVGFGDTSIFEQIKVDKFGDTVVHISIDGSYSMESGSRWFNTLKSTVAIITAADKIKNLDVVVSIRSTMPIYHNNNVPIMVIAYDSKVDNLAKVKSLFPYLSPDGTPEGLCFEAIMDKIINSTKGKKGYFINFSDGEPNIWAKNRSLSPEEIVRQNVNKMVANNIKVLSFFIGNEYYQKDFSYMYGKSARTIDVNSMTKLAKELNTLFATTK